MHQLGAAKRSSLAPKAKGERGESAFRSCKSAPLNPSLHRDVHISAGQGQQEYCRDFASHAETIKKDISPRCWQPSGSSLPAASDNTLQSRASPPQETEAGMGKIAGVWNSLG